MGMLWRNRWRVARWSLFLMVLGAVGTGLYVMLPAESRWVLAEGPMGAFYVAGGHFATYASPDGTATGPLQLWDAATGFEVDRFLNGVGPFLDSSHSDDGRRFVALVKGDNPGVLRIRGVDLEARREWQCEAPVGQFESALFSPHCEFVALRIKAVDATERSHVIVDTSSGRVVARLAGASQQIVFSGNAVCLAAGYCDEDDLHFIRAVDTETGKVTVIDEARFLGVSPDGRWIIGDRGEDGVWLWDMARSRWHVALADAKAPASTRLLDLNGVWLAGGTDFVITHYARRTFRSVGGVKVFSSKGRGLLYSILLADRAANHGDGQSFSPDSKSLLWHASADSGTQQWKYYDVETGKPRWKRPSEQTTSQAQFTPDSRELLLYLPEHGRAEVVDADNGETMRTIPIAGLENPTVQLSRDGRRLVVIGPPPEEEPHWFIAKIEEWVAPPRGAAPLQLRAFDLQTGAAIADALIEEGDEHSLTEDARTLVTVSSERGENGIVATTIRGWDVPPPKPLRWVLGAPIALGLALLSLRLGWRRLRRSAARQRPPVAVGDGTSSL
jgi:WD40 repeat protein